MLPSMLIASVLAAVPPAGEMPAIGVIEVYGARPVVEQQILQALQIKVGEWTDLNKSSLALAALTEARDPILMADLHARALPSLIEMARWKSHGHAEAVFVVLGRLVGLHHDEIQAAFERGDRALVLDAAAKLAK